jgi:hypothetical protein
VVRGINEVIESFEGLADLKSGKPAIGQFVTLMSAVKRYQHRLFKKVLKMPLPSAVDIPALRKWVSYSVVGGRTMAYWRTFYSSYTNGILLGARDLTEVWKELKRSGEYTKVMDVTSLYPYVMFEYPMPCVGEENMRFVTNLECEAVLAALDCKYCMQGWKLCEDHRIGGLCDLANFGFLIIFVVDLKHAGSSNSPNLCPRKRMDGAGLAYHFLSSEEELGNYFGKLPEGKRFFPEVHAYTMYDVMWMRKCGWSFTVWGGMSFVAGYGFREYTHSLFQKRIEAKEKEKREGLPKSLSTFYKLFYNGGYGINVQKDIKESYIVTREEDEAVLRSSKQLKPDEEIVRNIYSHQCSNGQWVLKIRKMDAADEYFSEHSPNQIGSAVVAAARHHMNLCMYDAAKCGALGYTDTDSACLLGSYLEEKCPKEMVDESTSAAMGTYKNDHEFGEEELVFLSFFIAKKVKVHFTLDKAGEVRIYPTFKGYNPSAVDELTGKKRSPLEAERLKVMAIVEAFFTGELGAVTQTEFKRNLGMGISIDKNAVFSASKKAFLGHSKGTNLVRVGSSEVNPTLIEEFVPLGSQKEVLWLHSKSGRVDDVEQPEERVAFWEDKIGYGRLVEFLDRYYEKKKRSMEAMESTIEQTRVFEEFDTVFMGAPQLTDEDRSVWIE